MKVKTFFIGLIAAFALPWLIVIAYPFVKLQSPEAIEFDNEDGDASIYTPKHGGRLADGVVIYRQENCQTCHTQLVRNSLASSDVFRSVGASIINDDKSTTVATEAGVILKDKTGSVLEDTRRETTSFDYYYSADPGERAIGPDLLNYASRAQVAVAARNKANAKAIASGEIKALTVETYIYLHLYDPRKDDSLENGLKSWSTCPSNFDFFEKIKITGQKGHVEALPIKCEEGYQIVPNSKAKRLVAYLLTRKHDDQLPPSLNKGPKAKK